MTALDSTLSPLELVLSASLSLACAMDKESILASPDPISLPGYRSPQEPPTTRQPYARQGSRYAPRRSPQGQGDASAWAKGQGSRYGPSVRSGYRPGNRGHVADTSKMVRRAT